ncbi:ABC transporter permease [Actinophytocola gossypii]|uniref:ABC transporter permease n=1 Tax=Actinophytocola gossypii TaxID=2812003 RepID=A0ABT2JB39_9PSEU|nr:ABC transporter permease [Actinophytocola gossypii]MCT2584665.1 ABC transporter permease [Actinophytocola gossypii]
MNTRRPVLVAVLLGVVGAVAATVLGFLTFGAQATAAPDHLPLAVSASDDALRPAAQLIAERGGDTVEWRVAEPDAARQLLADKEVYGILELEAGQRGVTPTVVVSGAVNPQGTQVAQQILTGAANGLAGALGQQGVQVAPPSVDTVHAASTAARTAPLAASALLWLGGLVASIAFGLLVVRSGMRVGPLARATLLTSAAVLVSGAVVGLLRLWDADLPLGADVLGFVLLTAVAFASVQGALLRLLRLRAAVILGPLYLLAPAVAGQVPEMLDPAYRTLLWSWTPFRFSTEGLRSLLQGTPDAPDVRLGVLVLAGMAVAGLVVMLWPGRAGATPEPASTTAREPVLTG